MRIVRFGNLAGRTLMSALLSCCAIPILALADNASQPDTLQALGTDGEIVAELARAPGEGWCLAWNHSVRHFTVLDCYRNVAGEMQLERSHQPDFAAGLGHSPGRGEQVSDGQGGYWINDIHEPVADNRYALRVGSREVDHRLIWEEGGETHTLSLSDQASGERVIFQLITLDH
ncbi:hypothetical protein SAMN05192555_103190 [Franzmannia pantelleriensis]|uniref:DUF1850 domain-containing protein n=1 Tax=Franzmannia pantelleriensis TaxID=48727 RepID=A0A1G9IIQ5_9GAMM|nr:DUF1850 domain-containing protein [Halomonas pantelleriensis]SDL25108.1 hypothetical protein SAMN05192555_103190 [Halomonas pantelleriensis]